MVRYNEDELDMSRLVLGIYERAVDKLRDNPTPILEFLDNLDTTEIDILNSADQDRARMYLKCRPVFDELFLQQIIS